MAKHSKPRKSKSKAKRKLPAHARRKNFAFLIVPALAVGAAGIGGLWLVNKVSGMLDTTSSAAGLLIPSAVGGTAGYLTARYLKLDRNIAIAATVGSAGLGYLSAKGIQSLKALKAENEKAEWCKANPWLAMLPGSGCP
jgi:hypothetical protein